MAARAVVVALCAVALMGTGANARAGAGANGRVREEAAREALASLRNVSDAQVAALHSAALLAAQDVTRFLIGRFQQMTTMTETEAEEMLAQWEALETEAATGAWHITVDDGDGDGDGDDDGDGDGDGDHKETTHEAIRRVLHEGWDSKGIPPLDPLNISYIPIDIDAPDVLRLQGKLEDFSFDGLATFQESFSLSILQTSSSIRAAIWFDPWFPLLRVRTQYEAEGSTDAGLDIWGDGLIEILLYELRMRADIDVNLPSTSSPIVNLCRISVPTRSPVEFKIEGLFGDSQLSELASEIITNNINKEYVWDALFDSISTTVEDGMCGYLRSLSRAQYLAIFFKYICKPPSCPWSKY